MTFPVVFKPLIANHCYKLIGIKGSCQALDGLLSDLPSEAFLFQENEF